MSYITFEAQNNQVRIHCDELSNSFEKVMKEVNEMRMRIEKLEGEMKEKEKVNQQMKEEIKRLEMILISKEQKQIGSSAEERNRGLETPDKRVGLKGFEQQEKKDQKGIGNAIPKGDVPNQQNTLPQKEYQKKVNPFVKPLIPISPINPNVVPLQPIGSVPKEQTIPLIPLSQLNEKKPIAPLNKQQMGVVPPVYEDYSPLQTNGQKRLDEQLYSCPFCLISFKSLESVEDHLYKEHSSQLQ